jgi:lysophospholipase
MVLSAPLIKIKDQPLSINTMRNISGFMKLIGLGSLPTYRQKDWKEITPFEENVLTSSKERYERNTDFLRQDPNLGVGCPSFAWLNSAIRAMKYIHSNKFIDSYAVPTLIMSASKDQVVSSDAIDLYCNETPYCHHLSVQGAEHEILQEHDYLREQFFAAYKAFIPGSG